jgi:hypothetical protein
VTSSSCPNRPLSLRLALITIGAAAALAGCDHSTEANHENFIAGVNAYLAERGHLCLAKYQWPIDVTPADAVSGTRNAVQMPVLQKLGLVSDSDVVVEFKTDEKSETLPVKRFALTAEGAKYFLKKEIRTVGADGKTIVHAGDFCVATLTLDKVIGWDAPHDSNGRKESTVTYTYRIDPAPWLADPEARAAFPVAANVVAGAGTQQLREVFVLSPKGWVASSLLN